MASGTSTPQHEAISALSDAGSSFRSSQPRSGRASASPLVSPIDAGHAHSLVSSAPSLDNNSIAPAVNASLVTEILSLRRELDHKNASIDGLEAELHASSLEVESIKSRLSRFQRDSAAQQKQFDEAERHLQRVTEDLIGERDQALTRSQDLRNRLNALSIKTRRQEDDFEKWQTEMEQKSAAWGTERQTLERRMNLAEDMLKNILESMQSRSEQAAAEVPPSTVPDALHASPERSFRHRRGMSSGSMHSLNRPLSSHSAYNVFAASKTLADELTTTDDEAHAEEDDPQSDKIPVSPERRRTPAQSPDRTAASPRRARSIDLGSPVRRPDMDPVRLLPAGAYPPVSPVKQASTSELQPLPSISFEQPSPARSPHRIASPERRHDSRLMGDSHETRQLKTIEEDDVFEVEMPSKHAPTTTSTGTEAAPAHAVVSELPAVSVSSPSTTSSVYAAAQLAPRSSTAPPTKMVDSEMQTEEIRIDPRSYESNSTLAMLLDALKASRDAAELSDDTTAVGKDSSKDSVSAVSITSHNDAQKPFRKSQPVNRSRSANNLQIRPPLSATLPSFPEEEPMQAETIPLQAQTAETAVVSPLTSTLHEDSPPTSPGSFRSAMSRIRLPPYPVPDRQSSRFPVKLPVKSGHSRSPSKSSPTKKPLVGRSTGLRKARSATAVPQAGPTSPVRRRADTKVNRGHRAAVVVSDNLIYKPGAGLLSFDLDQLAREPALNFNPPRTLTPVDELRDDILIDAIATATVGAWIWKYASRRSALCAIDGEKKLHRDGSRRKQWVWCSPEDRILMWSAKQPASGTILAARHKRRINIKTVLDVKDDSPLPKTANNGMSCFDRSIIVLSPDRSMKFTATSREQHYAWLMALSYLADTAQGPPQVPRLPLTINLPGTEHMTSDPKSQQVIQQSLLRANANILAQPRAPVLTPKLPDEWHNVGYTYAVDSTLSHKAGYTTPASRPGTSGSITEIRSIPRFRRASRPSSAGTTERPTALASLRSLTTRRAPSVKAPSFRSARAPKPAPVHVPAQGEIRMAAFVDAQHIDDEDEDEDFESATGTGVSGSTARRDPFQGF